MLPGNSFPRLLGISLLLAVTACSAPNDESLEDAFIGIGGDGAGENDGSGGEDGDSTDSRFCVAGDKISGRQPLPDRFVTYEFVGQGVISGPHEVHEVLSGVDVQRGCIFNMKVTFGDRRDRLYLTFWKSPDITQMLWDIENYRPTGRPSQGVVVSMSNGYSLAGSGVVETLAGEAVDGSAQHLTVWGRDILMTKDGYQDAQLKVSFSFTNL